MLNSNQIAYARSNPVQNQKFVIENALFIFTIIHSFNTPVIFEQIFQEQQTNSRI